MSIKIDKKYVEHFIINRHRVGDTVRVKIECAIITAIDGDEYTLEIFDSERQAFIDKCCDRCIVVATPLDYGRLYDAGARFKC
jgi:hypothetical protein